MEFNKAYPKGSDESLLRKLHASLDARPKVPAGRIRYSTRRGRSRLDWMDTLWAYLEGDPPLQQIDQSRAEDLREFIRMGRANYARVTVEAMLDRITLLGVRTAKDGDANGDDEFQRLLALCGPWLRDTLTFTFGLGEGLVMVGKGQDPSVPVVVTAEDPRLVAYTTDPLDPSRVTNVLKTYVDEDGVRTAHVFTGERGQERVRVATMDPERGGGWQWDDDRSGDLKVRGEGLPFVPYVNPFGLGEFETHLDVLDRINNMIADRLWISKIQAHRQRALEADAEAKPMDDKDENGNDIDFNDLFRAAPDAMWELPPGRKIWESTPVDMQGILASVRDDVKEYAAVSQTPLFMFTPDAASGSAEGASSMKETLELKCNDRIDRFTAPTRRVARLMYAYAGLEVPDQIEPLWAPVEKYSLQQKTASAAQAKAAGVPLETILSEVMQLSPLGVQRALDQRVNELLLTEAAAGATSTPATPADAPAAQVGGNG